MDAKNKLIEKLLRNAKKHKILTYPVLALVAIISFFGNLFNWRNGAGKRIVAIIMVMVMFVSQSYFLTSSATALVDTEEEALIQKELQEESIEKDEETSNEEAETPASTEAQKEVPDDNTGNQSAESDNTEDDQSAGTENTEAATSDENGDLNAGENATTEITDLTNEDEEELDSKLEDEKIKCIFYTVDEGGQARNLGSAYELDYLGEDATYDLNSIVSSQAFNNAVIAEQTGDSGEKYKIYPGTWYSNTGLTSQVNISAVSKSGNDSDGNPVIQLYCKKVLSQYRVNIKHRKSNGDTTSFSTDPVFTTLPASESDGVLRVDIDDVDAGDDKYGYLYLSGVSRTGYSLAGVEVDKGEVTNLDLTTGSATVKITGKGESRDVYLVWKPDTYYIDYVTNEKGDTERQSVTFDGADMIRVGANLVTPPDGYVFSGNWKLRGSAPEYRVSENTKVSSYQSQFYTAAECAVTLEPINRYDGIKLNKNSVEFTYKETKNSGLIQAQYTTLGAPSGESKFSYTLAPGESANKLASHGITFDNSGSNGFILKTNDGGPTEVSDPFDIQVQVTDGNAPDETIPEQTVTITIKPFQVEIVEAEGMNTTKTYDGTTNVNFTSTGDIGTLITNIPDEVKVTYKTAEVAYNSADVKDANRIVFSGNLTMVLIGSGLDQKNYVLKKDQYSGYSIPGKIEPKKINVIPKIHFINGKSYVRTGEDDPTYTFTVNKDDLIEKDKNNIEWLDDIAYKTNRPDNKEEECLAPRYCQLYSVNTEGIEVGSNYKLDLSYSDVVATQYEVKKEATQEGVNYSISGDRSSEDNEWYYNSNNRGIAIVPEDVYNTVMISTTGESGSYAPLGTVSDTYSNNSNVWIYLLSDKSKGGTGAVSSKIQLNLKYDGTAPEYKGYTFVQQGEGDDSLEYTSGEAIPEGGLYFPGIGGVMDFGTYTKSTIHLKVKYDDTMSGLKTLHYGLFGDEPNRTVDFDKTTGYATIEVLASMVKQAGVIQCYAEDVAGNTSNTIRLSPTGQDDNYEWSVEQVAPTIDYFGVKYRVGTEEDNHYETVYSSREWYNHCRAELKVSDAAAGLHEIDWYINDELADTKVYNEKTTTSDTLVKEINQSVYPSDNAGYSVYAEIHDNAGNIKKTDIIQFKVDDVAPTLVVHYDDKVWTQDTTISFDVKDDLSGVDYAKVTDSEGKTIDCKLEKQNEEGWYTASFDATTKGDYMVVAVDHAGNVSEWKKNINMISKQRPDCPVITFAPAEPDGENGWYKNTPSVTIQNVKQTEDETPVTTKYQMWMDGDQPLNETTVSGDGVTREIPGDGIYNIKAWSTSASGMDCIESEDDEVQVKVDTAAPTIDFTTAKGSGASILINFTITDTGSGINPDTIKVLHGSQELVAELEENEGVYTGSFEIKETGDYTIAASDIAGNAAEAAAFTPMSMKVKAVTNISTRSATLGANIYKGTFDISSASIAYRKVSEDSYTEAQSMLNRDDNGNVAVSAVLSDLSENTAYVFKITAVSDAPAGSSAGEVLEYEGYFKTLSSSGNGISIKGTARYASQAEGEITVGVFEGNMCIMATEVNAGDEFTFDNIPDGNYSIVATDGVYSKTMRLLIQDGVVVYPTKYIELILSGKNTSVVITSDDTPNISADNMDSIFEDDPINYTVEDEALVENGGTVEFKLYATLMTISGVSADEISAMYAVTDNNKIVGAYLDLSLYKIVTDVDGNVERKRVTELAKGANVSVTIPLGELAGKPGLEVVRIHDTGERFVGASLKDMDNNPNTYTITTTQFSTYAVLYSPDNPASEENTTEAATENIKDGTTDPSENGTINSGGEVNNTDPDKDDNNTKKNSSKNNNGSSSSVGSLRSAGSAKTGDAAPVVVLGVIMSISLAGFFVLRRKADKR